jgi:hypothetical protein
VEEVTVEEVLEVVEDVSDEVDEVVDEASLEVVLEASDEVVEEVTLDDVFSFLASFASLIKASNLVWSTDLVTSPANEITSLVELLE